MFDVIKGWHKYQLNLQFAKSRNRTTWIIQDWAGNVQFHGQEFDSFDDGEEFLCETLGDDYETDRGEYYVIEK
jgi:hypothetical protein